LNGARPLRLELAPSRWFAGVILVVHMLAAASFLTSLTAWPGALLAVLIFGLGCFAAWDRALLKGEHSPIAIEIQASGDALVLLRDGKFSQLSAVQGIGVTRFWVALAAALPARRSVLVVSGMLGEESFRRLRLWALWGKVPGVVPGQLAGSSAAR